MDRQLPTFMAVDATQLYWTVRGTPAPYDSQGGVWKVPLAGGSPVTLFTGYVAGPLAIDASSIYWATGDIGAPPPWPFPPPSTTLCKVPLAGGTPAVVTSGWNAISAIAVDETSVYLLDAGPAQSGHGTVAKVPLGGGAPVTLATGQTFLMGPGTDSNWGIALAVDASSVYWGTAGTQAENYSDGAVMKVPLTGGPPVTVALGQISVSGLAVDETSVYWANRFDGSIMKATPK
jgi:hypothetical protein